MKDSYIVKIIVFMSLLTAFIIGMSIFSQQLLQKDSRKLESAIDITEKCTDAGDWKGAEKSLDALQKDWSGVKGMWSALIDHQEIDNIDVTLSRLKMLVKAKELPSSLSEAAALKKYIGHIPSKEKLTLENLF